MTPANPASQTGNPTPAQAPIRRRFVIDGIFFQIGQSGIARVWTELLRHWRATGFADEVLVIDRGRTMPRLPGIAYADGPRFAFETEAQDRAWLQSVCDQVGAVVFASTYYTRPLHTPQLLMVHDMIPEVLGYDLSTPMWAQKQQALASASAFIAVSRHTGSDLQRLAGRAEAPLAITPNGCDFRPAAPEAVQDFRRRHGLVQPYFLLSGSRADYKNAWLFFEAYERLGASAVDPDPRAGFAIFCTGGGVVEPELLAMAGPAEVRVGVLSDADMACAYTGAVALVYPSRYEGFGLPVLEAMACACPVICSDAASLPEVGGDAPLYVSIGLQPTAEQAELETAQLLQRLREVLEPERRFQMITRGLQQAQRFSWARMADGVAQALNALAARSTASTETACRLCGAATRPLFRQRVLQRHDIGYFQCDTCGASQTERPHWLAEAYVAENEQFDTGQVTRSLINAALLNLLIRLGGLGRSTRLVDHGCGSGLLVRVLRDAGVDAWGYDLYSQPRLALGFQTADPSGFDVVNLCEVVEHFDQPGAAFDAIFASNPQLVVIQTGVTAQLTPGWDYLAPEHGQHIFFLAPRTLAWLAQRHGRVHLNLLGFQLLMRLELAERLVDPTSGGLRAEHQAALNQLLPALWQDVFARPYAHASADNRLLRERDRLKAEAGAATAP